MSSPASPPPPVDWQEGQGKACPCRGSDDYCPCQNVSPEDRARQWSADGYRDAFYELAALMDLGADTRSPAKVWRETMLPRLTAALAAIPSRDAAMRAEGYKAGIEAAARVADQEAALRRSHYQAHKAAGRRTEARDFETMVIAASQVAAAIRALPATASSSTPSKPAPMPDA